MGVSVQGKCENSTISRTSAASVSTQTSTRSHSAALLLITNVHYSRSAHSLDLISGSVSLLMPIGATEVSSFILEQLCCRLLSQHLISLTVFAEEVTKLNCAHTQTDTHRGGFGFPSCHFCRSGISLLTSITLLLLMG